MYCKLLVMRQLCCAELWVLNISCHIYSFKKIHEIQNYLRAGISNRPQPFRLGLEHWERRILKKSSKKEEKHATVSYRMPDFFDRTLVSS